MTDGDASSKIGPMKLLREMREIALGENLRSDWTLSEAKDEGHKFKVGDIVRRTAAAMRSMGVVSGPVNGKVVGYSGRFALIQWSDMDDNDEPMAQADAGLELDKRAMAKQGKKSEKKEVRKKADIYHDHDFDDDVEPTGSVVAEMQELLGEAPINSPMSKAAMKYMRSLKGGEAPVNAVASKLGKMTHDTEWVLDQLVKDGQLKKDSAGYYKVAEETETCPFCGRQVQGGKCPFGPGPHGPGMGRGRGRGMGAIRVAGESSDVANTIAAQMGGVGRLKMMLGAKMVAAMPDGNGLAIKWPNKDSKKGNYVEIRLRPDDTYDMEFFWMRGTAGKKSVKKYEMIYADQLTGLFRDWTGWALKL